VAIHHHIPHPDNVGGRNFRCSVRTIRMEPYQGLHLREDLQTMRWFSTLPGGEEAKGASLIAASLILTPALPGGEEAYPGTCAPPGEKGVIQ
jgi:hypothetical protein